MSDTPRSDNLIKRHGFSTTRNGEKAVLVSDYKFSEDAFALARQLESELAEARAEIERLKAGQASDAEKLAPYILKKNQQLHERDALIKQMLDAAEMLWIVLANVNGGDWAKQSYDWQAAAVRWRDHYLKTVETAKGGK